MTVFSKNLKRFRLAKQMTQEQAGEVLGVSTQTVSRWECGTTVPDAMLLPKIAKLYCVTIDDLYRESGVAYENYAQRLLAVFEASHKPEDFLQAYMEYQKLLGSDRCTANDLRSYGILHQYMLQLCREEAEAAFDRVIRKGPAEDPAVYWSTCRQKGYFLWQLGRNRETIDTYLPLVEGGSRELQAWICLIQAYTLAQEYGPALAWTRKAEESFPESAILHIYAGDLLRSLKRYEEAFPHWNRALELEPKWRDAAYSIASCYEELGDYPNACAAYTRLAWDLESSGFTAEAAWPRAQAQKCREKASAI